jgi:membrane protein
MQLGPIRRPNHLPRFIRQSSSGLPARSAAMTRPAHGGPPKRRKTTRPRAVDSRPLADLAAAPAAMSRLDRVTGYARDLFFKFTNDCTMSLVSMIAFSVLTSFVPLILAVVLFLALLPASSARANSFAEQISLVLPSAVSKDANIAGLINSIHQASGILTIVTILGLLWGGSNLFGSIESAFAFIYRVKTRDFLPQKAMALVLILVFVILLPFSFVSSFLLASATTTLGRVMPGALTGTFSAIIGLGVGLFSLFILLTVIYTVVPNMPLAWRETWRGALFATVAMWTVNTIFPFYAAHFIGTKQYGAATISTVIITITWVYFFSLMLLIGAQINALALGLAPWKYDLTRILMETDGPFLISRRRYRGHRRRAPLPFSGLIHDSHKVRREIIAGRDAPLRQRVDAPVGDLADLAVPDLVRGSKQPPE